MDYYLKDIPLSDAQTCFQNKLIEVNLWDILGIDEIPLDEQACGRILADPIWAIMSSPHYNASGMDGFAIRSLETIGASTSKPILLRYGIQTLYVDTGDPLPDWADAVIPIENVEPLNEFGHAASNFRKPNAIRIRAGITPWKNIRLLGEDIVASELVLPSGHLLRAVDLGAIAACGHSKIRVTRKPRVAILPTGTELIPIGKPAKIGEITEYNSLVMAAQINNWGGKATRFSITPDDIEILKLKIIEAAQENDLILLNAGSSAGMEDFSAQVIASLGTVLVHGVAVRPGHPVILGMLHTPRIIPIIGVPGYPVSAALTMEIFIEPLITRWLGKTAYEPPTIRAKLTRKVVSPAGDEDYLRVVVGKVGNQILAAPLTRGAGVITSLVRSDGITIIPRGIQGLQANEDIQVRLYSQPHEIEKTIIAIGSHDIILDIIAQFLAQRTRRLVSSNVGSLGGLIALQNSMAHIAGSHLLDTQTGEYNISYIKEYIPNTPVNVITLAGRQQGLILQKNNPKEIRGLRDLTRDDIRYVNRQRGAGTRVLLDYHLNLENISPSVIQGYGLEEYTHLAVGATVSSNRADCGLGIAAAARALDLDFIPLFQERYDLVVPLEHAENELLKPLFDLLDNKVFQKQVSILPGYDISDMGKTIKINI